VWAHDSCANFRGLLQKNNGLFVYFSPKGHSGLALCDDDDDDDDEKKYSLFTTQGFLVV